MAIWANCGQIWNFKVYFFIHLIKLQLLYFYSTFWCSKFLNKFRFLALFWNFWFLKQFYKKILFTIKHEFHTPILLYMIAKYHNFHEPKKSSNIVGRAIYFFLYVKNRYFYILSPINTIFRILHQSSVKISPYIFLHMEKDIFKGL